MVEKNKKLGKEARGDRPKKQKRQQAADAAAATDPAPAGKARHAIPAVTEASAGDDESSNLAPGVAKALHRLESGDADAATLEFVATLPPLLAETTISDFLVADLSEVKSRKGYLMGMLRQRQRGAQRANKQKELLQKKELRRPDDEAHGGEKSTWANKPGKNPDYPEDEYTHGGTGVSRTIFVNQVPYAATVDEIAWHFSEAAETSASDLRASVRMLSKEGSFTGACFVDMPSEEVLICHVMALCHVARVEWRVTLTAMARASLT